MNTLPKDELLGDTKTDRLFHGTCCSRLYFQDFHLSKHRECNQRFRIPINMQTKGCGIIDHEWKILVILYLQQILHTRSL